MGEMTRGERTELAAVVRIRAKVARNEVDAAKAKLLADFEQQVATEYEQDDGRWARYVAAGTAAVEKANEEILRVFKEEGIPATFAPSATVGWTPRGSDWQYRSRRNELRQVAIKRLDALAKAAKVEIDRSEADIRSELAASALTSDQAKAFLDRLPTVDQLMPRLQLDEIETAADAKNNEMHRLLGRAFPDE